MGKKEENYICNFDFPKKERKKTLWDKRKISITFPRLLSKGKREMDVMYNENKE